MLGQSFVGLARPVASSPGHPQSPKVVALAPVVGQWPAWWRRLVRRLRAQRVVPAGLRLGQSACLRAAPAPPAQGALAWRWQRRVPRIRVCGRHGPHARPVWPSPWCWGQKSWQSQFLETLRGRGCRWPHRPPTSPMAPSLGMRCANQWRRWPRQGRVSPCTRRVARLSGRGRRP